MIYFTSDLHFFHNNIIKHCNRPFNNNEEMDKILLINWNSRVRDEDEIYILGDLTLKGIAKVNSLVPKLNGKKYLVRGNHDLFADKEELDSKLFEWIKDYYELNYEGMKFTLSHYPFASWNERIRGAVHLHGHIHAKEEYNIKNAIDGHYCFDVGVDAHNFFPVSIEEIIELTKINPSSDKSDRDLRNI